MSQQSMSTPSTQGAGCGKINPDPLVFLQTILVSMTNRPEVDWNTIAKKVGYNTGETAKARFRQMKRKFNDTQSDGQLRPSVVSPSTPRVNAKVKRSRRNVRGSSPPKVIKEEPLASTAKNTEDKKPAQAKRTAKRIKMEAQEDSSRGTDGSFAKVDDSGSE